MHFAIVTEEIHEQAISSVMERIKIHPKIFDPEHVFNKSTIIFQLAACITKRQHNQPIVIAKNQHIIIPLQLQSHRSITKIIKEKDR